MVNYRKRNRSDLGDENGETSHGARVQRTSYSLRSKCVEKFKNEELLSSGKTKMARAKNEAVKLRSGLRSDGKIPSNTVEKRELSYASDNSTTNKPKVARAKNVRNSHTNTKQADSMYKTEPNEANTNNYRQLRLRPTTKKVDKAEEQRGLELCKVEKKISTQNRIPNVIRGPDDISQGCIVLVKWPSFPYWPARVLDICRNIANVMFFGDSGRTAKVKVDRLFHLTYSTNYIIYILQSQQWARVYTKAIREAEIYSGIEFNESILNIIS